MRVKFKKTDQKAQTPTRGSREAAGYEKLTVAEKGVAQSHRKQIESPEEIKQITEEFLRSIA